MTADRAAADTLRDEDDFCDALNDAVSGEYVWLAEKPSSFVRDLVLPVVRRYADAQVAAERERIARAIETIPAVPDTRRRALREAALIVRGGKWS